MSRPDMPLRRRLPVLAAAVVFVVSACNASSSPSPAASGGGGAAPASGQFCTGVKLVFFPGGTAGGGFETVVYNGAKAAQAAFGPDITYQWSDWDPQQDDHPVPAGRWRPSPTASPSWATRVTTPSTR